MAKVGRVEWRGKSDETEAWKMPAFRSSGKGQTFAKKANGESDVLKLKAENWNLFTELEFIIFSPAWWE